MSEFLDDFDGVKAIVDDLLIWGKDYVEHDARLKQVVNRTREVDLKFNAKKCQITQELEKLPMLVMSSGKRV